MKISLIPTWGAVLASTAWAEDVVYQCTGGLFYADGKLSVFWMRRLSYSPASGHIFKDADATSMAGMAAFPAQEKFTLNCKSSASS
jgi:hypothetical protein